MSFELNQDYWKKWFDDERRIKLEKTKYHHNRYATRVEYEEPTKKEKTYTVINKSMMCSLKKEVVTYKKLLMSESIKNDILRSQLFDVKNENLKHRTCIRQLITRLNNHKLEDN